LRVGASSLIVAPLEKTSVNSDCGLKSCRCHKCNDDTGTGRDLASSRSKRQKENSMAFFLSMPLDFKVGDTCNCSINFAPKRVTWRDPNTLVIEPDDARRIVQIARDSELINFIRADADGEAPEIVTPLDMADRAPAGHGRGG
jgi:hypothetical protein